MTIKITDANIQSLAPRARFSYRQGFSDAQTVLDRFGISDNALRVAHFMAQILHESGGLTFQFENLVASPDDAIGADWCVAAASAVWEQKGCNALAD